MQKQTFQELLESFGIKDEEDICKLPELERRLIERNFPWQCKYGAAQGGLMEQAAKELEREAAERKKQEKAERDKEELREKDIKKAISAAQNIYLYMGSQISELGMECKKRLREDLRSCSLLAQRRLEDVHGEIIQEMLKSRLEGKDYAELDFKKIITDAYDDYDLRQHFKQ
jgi:flagellar biosynthesis GTPase FlhF